MIHVHASSPALADGGERFKQFRIHFSVQFVCQTSTIMKRTDISSYSEMITASCTTLIRFVRLNMFLNKSSAYRLIQRPLFGGSLSESLTEQNTSRARIFPPANWPGRKNKYSARACEEGGLLGRGSIIYLKREAWA